MKITLHNSFHQSQVTIRANIGDVLSLRQARRVDGLCGIKDCACYTFDQITDGVSLMPIYTDAGKSYRVWAS